MAEKFNPGDSVFVVLRDNGAHPLEVSGYIFLARVQDTVFASPIINGHRDLEMILCYLMSVTETDDELPLVAVPVDDCYHTKDEAKEAMRNECEY